MNSISKKQLKAYSLSAFLAFSTFSVFTHGLSQPAVAEVVSRTLPVVVKNQTGQQVRQISVVHFYKKSDANPDRKTWRRLSAGGTTRSSMTANFNTGEIGRNWWSVKWQANGIQFSTVPVGISSGSNLERHTLRKGDTVNGVLIVLRAGKVDIISHSGTSTIGKVHTSNVRVPKAELDVAGYVQGQIQNRWKPEQKLHVEQGLLQSGAAKREWLSAKWTSQTVSGQREFFRIKNQWKPNQFIHIENGVIEASLAKNEWHSAQWTLEATNFAGYYRIRNRWKPNVYLHIENGKIEAGNIQKSWWSAMWHLGN